MVSVSVGRCCFEREVFEIVSNNEKGRNGEDHFHLRVELLRARKPLKIEKAREGSVSTVSDRNIFCSCASRCCSGSPVRRRRYDILLLRDCDHERHARHNPNIYTYLTYSFRSYRECVVRCLWYTKRKEETGSVVLCFE
jgi:hypothetical protein